MASLSARQFAFLTITCGVCCLIGSAAGTIGLREGVAQAAPTAPVATPVGTTVAPSLGVTVIEMPANGIRWISKGKTVMSLTYQEKTGLTVLSSLAPLEARIAALEATVDSKTTALGQRIGGIENTFERHTHDFEVRYYGMMDARSLIASANQGASIQVPIRTSSSQSTAKMKTSPPTQ